jgi:predicted amidophosphoribosyltransferase
MQGAFLFKTGAVVPRKAVIVDDIFTTGSTMKECAAALRMAGVEQVAGLVLATGRSMEA